MQSEIGLSSADDSDILSWCLSNQAIAVTLDADFHARIALSVVAVHPLFESESRV